MITFRISTNTNSLDELQRRLQNLPMGEVAAIGERLHRGYYAEEAGPDGGWTPLSESTLRQKRSGAILRETSTMAGSVSSSASNNEARIFSTGPFYNIFHQLGTSKMSARKHIGIRPGHEQKYLRPIEEHLNL